MHWRRKWQPTPVFLPGESQGRGSLVGCRLWDRTESDTTEIGLAIIADQIMTHAGCIFIGPVGATGEIGDLVTPFAKQRRAAALARSRLIAGEERIVDRVEHRPDQFIKWLEVWRSGGVHPRQHRRETHAQQQQQEEQQEECPDPAAPGGFFLGIYPRLVCGLIVGHLLTRTVVLYIRFLVGFLIIGHSASK